MIHRGLFTIVLVVAFASALLGQENTGARSVDRGDVPQKIAPQVREIALTNASIQVFVVLAHQPQKEIFERAQAASQLRREIVEGRYRQLVNVLLPASEVLQQAREAVDQVEVETRQAAFREIDDSIGAEQTALESDLAGMGARNITRYRGINMLAVEIPSSALPLLESDPRIAEVSLVEREHAQIAYSVPELGAPTFWTNGYTGQGESVALLDAGVRTNHPAFAGKTIISQVFLANGRLDSCFGDNASSAEDQSGHGTHLAGIIMSQGSAGWSSYQGVARGIDTLYNVKIAFKETSACGGGGSSLPSDVFTGLDWVVINTPAKVVNYSYGGTAVADDSSSARNWDYYADTYGLNVSISAGNSGPSSATVSSPGLAHNIISTGGWVLRGTMRSSSGRGPTLGGRYKPDVATPGTGIYSTAYNWDLGYPAFVAMSGTSMAAPHVAGSMALLRSAGVTKPLAAKAVLLNTTDNAGWAADRGWGYASLTRAWDQRNSSTGSLTAKGLPTGYALYKVGVSGDLRATLTWNRHLLGVVNAFTSALNNMDLYLYENSTGSTLDASEETIQNVEQVSASYSGDTVLKVKMFSSVLSGVSSEPYAVALSTSNWTAVSGPSLGVACTGPTPVAPSSTFTVSCTARNSGDLPAFSVSGGLNLLGGPGGLVLDYGTLAPLASASRSWTVTAPSAAGPYSLAADVSSTSFGESFSATGGLGFMVQASAPAPSISSISPATPTPSGISQPLTVNGSLFQSGLTVTAFPPGGGSSTLSGSQIQSVTSSSFQLSITLDSAGTWGIRVNNPDGPQSAIYSIAVGCAYAVSTSGLSVPASGGSVGLTIHTDPGCAWSITNLPTWVSVSGGASGAGSSTLTLAAGASSGVARTGVVTAGGVSVPIRQLDGTACGGSSSCVLRALPHLAYGGQWTTALSAVSSGTTAGDFSASFYGDSGSSLALPFTGGLGNLSTLTGAVSAGGMRYYEAENPSVGDLSGWGLVTADESVAAQVTFRRHIPGGQFYEAAVPSSGGYSRFAMPFDVGTFAPNGAQLFTAFAVVNLNPSATAHFVCTARSDSGVLIPNGVSIPALGSLGHYTAFNFPSLTGRGTIDCSADTLVSAIGIRSIGGDAVSTLPVIPK